MKSKVNSTLVIIVLAVLASLFAGYLIFLSKSISPSPFSLTSIIARFFPSPVISEFKGMKKFSSEADFKAYLTKTELKYSQVLFDRGVRDLALPMFEAPMALEEKVTPERVSETTVQVPGIDEPDIVKTDGQQIYFSRKGVYTWLGVWREAIIPPLVAGDTNIIKAFPPEDLNLQAKIEQQGDLLLTKNILVIFADTYIYGYDISQPSVPEKKWEIKLAEENQLLSARLYQDKIYLVTKSRIDTHRPCPIKLLSTGGVDLEIKCLDIYHPTLLIPVDVTFTAMILEPASGRIEKNISFVGSASDSILYLSENALYVTYSYTRDWFYFYSRFFKEKTQDLVPIWFTEKIERLTGYEISEQAKLIELQVIFEQYLNSLRGDERLKVENELSNRMIDYLKTNKRELEKTGLVKIGLEKFELEASGQIPGRPLNQFSLDEYKNYFRVATTIGETWRWGGPIGFLGDQLESVNDVYILDEDLKITGSVENLGLTERIYSVRFLEDKGYVVTFREIDPFYVLDLSDPTKPVLKGELKIPGYSSYLHPITKDKILGIGKENNQVKISLFDVEKPERPNEIAKYHLDEYWSDVLNTHHAFLLDPKHQIFFLPGSKGGYIFSYQDNKLELKKAVSEISAKRALYIDDYLYLVGDDKITVLDEINWEKIKELEL